MSTGNGDRLLICRRLLLSSPPGQFNLILADLRQIQKSQSDADVLTDDWADEVRAEYETATRRECLHDDSHGGEATDLAKALRDAMAKYMSDNYCGGGKNEGGDGQSQNATESAAVSNRSNFVVGGDDSLLTVKTYAENVDLRNFRAGSWSAEYTVRRISGGSSSSSEMQMEGCVDIVAHAFENGNVQTRSSVPLGPSDVVSESGAPEDTARAIVGQIRKWEDENVHSKLGRMFDSVNDGMLKSLRRVMPITRTRMDWNVGSHRLVKTMAERKAQEQEG